MTETEREAKLAELDRLLNDPGTRLDAARVWALAAELGAARHPPSPDRRGAALA